MEAHSLSDAEGHSDENVEFPKVALRSDGDLFKN
jgi:hypothetical protein